MGMVLEYVEGLKELGNTPSFDSVTRDVFPSETSFEFAWILQVARHVSSAVGHLHKHCVMHGDLYAHNTLVDMNTAEVKVGDFGAAFVYDRQVVGDAYERIEARAFGCLVDDLLQHLSPSWQGRRSSVALEQLRRLVRDCMDARPKMRPSFDSIRDRLVLIDSLHGQDKQVASMRAMLVGSGLVLAGIVLLLRSTRLAWEGKVVRYAKDSGDVAKLKGEVKYATAPPAKSFAGPKPKSDPGSANNE